MAPKTAAQKQKAASKESDAKASTSENRGKQSNKATAFKESKSPRVQAKTPWIQMTK
jgi:hypothetical protein